MIRAMIFISTLLHAEAPMGWIHGTVVDMNESMVPGIQIQVSSRSGKCQQLSNNEGRFNCQLPPGRYTITAAGANILPYERGTIGLASGDHLYVKLHPVFVGPSDQGAIKNPTLRYQSDKVGPTSEVMVRFQLSETHDTTIVFRGDYIMLTFEDMAIYAKELSCSAPIVACTGRGDVLIEIANEQLRGTIVDVDLLKRKLILTRDPTVVRTF